MNINIEVREAVEREIAEREGTDWAEGAKWVLGRLDLLLCEQMFGVDEGTPVIEEPRPRGKILPPQRNEGVPCSNQEGHAWLLNNPNQGQKLCRWCRDVLPMSEDERYASHRKPKSGTRRQVAWITA